MLDKNQIVTLALQVAKKDPKVSANFEIGGKVLSYEAMQETLRDEFNLLAGNYNSYRKNKNEIFEIMETVLDEVLPKRIEERYGSWAEIKQGSQGNKPSFTRKTGNIRAKQFITKVGLAGVYELFKLDKEKFEVETSAYGGAAQVGLEQFLDGSIDFVEITNIVLDGLEDKVYYETVTGMGTLVENLQGTNKGSGAGFVAATFDPLVEIARAYGEPTIFCTRELATKIVPEGNWISDEDKTAMRTQGYVGIYKGTKVVVLPQSFEDSSNTVKMIDPSMAYIVPSDGKTPPVKISLEGQVIIDESKNADFSREIQAYKKLGVAVVVSNDICAYQDTSLVQ